MHRTRVFILMGILAVGGAGTVFAQSDLTSPEQVGMSSAALARIKPAPAELADHVQTAGAITVVARKGKTVYSDSIGMQDIDAKKPMRRDTICRFYSMSKPITSLAVMMLV